MHRITSAPNVVHRICAGFSSLASHLGCRLRSQRLPIKRKIPAAKRSSEIFIPGTT